MDIKSIFDSKLSELVDNGKLEELIEEKTQKLLESVVSDALSRYSDFGKKLSTLVAKSLELPEGIDLPAYNSAILEIVTRQLEAGTKQILHEQIAENLSSLLTPLPQEIKLSEFAMAYKERVKADAYVACYCSEEEKDQQVYIKVDDAESSWTYILFSEKPITSKYDCSICVSLSHIGKKESPIVGEVFAVRFDNDKIESKLFRGDFYELEKYLLQAKLAKVKFVVDCDVDDLDLTYTTRDYE